jgi:hypothetical protein
MGMGSGGSPASEESAHPFLRPVHLGLPPPCWLAVRMPAPLGGLSSASRLAALQTRQAAAHPLRCIKHAWIEQGRGQHRQACMQAVYTPVHTVTHDSALAEPGRASPVHSNLRAAGTSQCKVMHRRAASSSNQFQQFVTGVFSPPALATERTGGQVRGARAGHNKAGRARHNPPAGGGRGPNRPCPQGTSCATLLAVQMAGLRPCARRALHTCMQCTQAQGRTRARPSCSVV